MKSFSKLLLFIIFGLVFLIPVKVLAAETKQVTIVHPIRGNDFWEHKFSTLEVPQKQYEVVKKNNLPVTWLVRYDALKDDKVVTFLKSLDKNQEIGVFMEITPTLTSDAGVTYNQSPNWHYPKSVFLLGYSIADRHKLIDTTFKKYSEIFGKNPKSVGAWWIESTSLEYMKQKYQIEANMDVADQYSTDLYQVWGQYFSVPFYPSKVNALMPAQSAENKIGVVTIQWATRDPFNAYGNGVGDSTYSVQANDYLIHDLKTSYFEKLLAIYPQTTVGLENDFSWDQFGEEYQNQLSLLTNKQKQGSIQLKTMQQFAQFYKSKYPTISPNELVVADDPLDGTGKVVWYQTPKYRVGWFYNATGSVIRDLRLFNDSEKELCFEKSCTELNLAFTVSKALDEVTFGSRWLIDEGRISDVIVTKTTEGVTITYKNQAGQARVIKFYQNDIQIDNQIKTVSGAIIDINSSLDQKPESKLAFKQKPEFLISQNLKRLSFESLKFLLLTVFFFLIPGFLLSRRLLTAIPVGWAVFTVGSFIFGYLSTSFLLWVIPIAGILGFLYQRPKLHLKKLNLKWFGVILLILLGSMSWLLTTIKNGLQTNYGIGFWGPNGHDGIWHLSLISELQRSIPPQNPIYANNPLTNYHYFFDLLIAESGKLFSINTMDLLFQFFPICIAILAGLLTFLTVKKLFHRISSQETGGFMAGFMATFFLYFGGSLGWVISYFREGSFGGESMFWAQQGISTLLNPPYAISLVFILAGLYLFLEYQKNLSSASFKNLFLVFKTQPLTLFISIVLLWGTVIEYKAYAGVLILVSLSLVAVINLLRKDFSLIPLAFLTGVLGLIVFLPNNLSSSGLFVYQPLWLVNTMILFQDRLNWPRLNLAIESGVLYKYIGGTALAILLFIVGNLGTRVIGFSGFKQLMRYPLLLFIALFGFLLSAIFIQKGTNWNVVQFFYYSIFVFCLFSGISFGIFYAKFKHLAIGFAVVIIVLTMPTTFDTARQYTPTSPAAFLSNKELEALNFLRQQPMGVVLTQPFDLKNKNRFSGPLPLYAYETTGYVSAFSEKPTFIEDMVNLDILGVDYKGRLNLQKDAFQIREKSKEIFRENNIGFLYVIKALGSEFDQEKMGIKKIFENDEVLIFKTI